MARCTGSCSYYRAIQGVAIILLKSKLFNWGTVDLQVLISWIYLWVPPPHLSACKGLVRKMEAGESLELLLGRSRLLVGIAIRLLGMAGLKQRLDEKFGVGRCR